MFKKIWKNVASRVWFCVSIALVALFLVITILASSVKLIYELFNMVLPGGGPRPQYADGVESIYLSDYDSKKEVYAAARDMNQTICEEGFVLLKNEQKGSAKALPLAAGSKISVFGKNSVNLAYGGSGSGGANTSNVINLYDALKDAGFDYNPTLYNFYDGSSSGPVRTGNSSDLDSGDTVILSTAETPQSMYTDAVKASYANYKDAAIIVITRIGGEGFDLPRLMKGSKGYRNEDDHFLQLDANEEDLIAAVCEAGFNKVVLVLNTGNAVELGFLEARTEYVTSKGYKINPDKIDAALWMGFPGETGTKALANILLGKVNPSGKLADTYAVDFKKDPTWYNFGDNRITSTGTYMKDGYVPGGDEYVFDVPKNEQPQVQYYFVEYEESVYVGYKYYETRGAIDGEEWYNKNVVYPFGYGLSYTQFTWSIADDAPIKNVSIEKGKTYKVDVSVKNTGTVAGKEVVQLYGHAPYTAGGVEKPEVVLVDFAKTELIEPGDTKTVTLEFDPYYLASYDYTDANGNGKKTFELDKGDDYALYVSASAHDKKFEIPFKVAADIIYDKDTVTGKNKVENRYTDCEKAGFNSLSTTMKLMSRTDFDGTMPATPTTEERNGSKELLGWLNDKNHNNPESFKGLDMPYDGDDNGMKLRDMLFDEDGEEYIGVDKEGIPHADFNDDRWELLLDQANISSLITMYDFSSYHIEAVDEIGLPRINCADGPVGWACFMDKNRFYDTCSYCAETLIATTWSKKVAEDFGTMVGNEGVIGDEKGGTPYSGWYAPGVNIHRSPFGGRNFEYYAEDGLLAGKMAAAQIRGCNSKGVFTFIKHFAANEQETHRSISGDSSWLSEQALREIFLRPFEIAVKEGDTHAVMSSFNRIGARWTGGDYRLLTEILRNEWGFKGCVLCDFNTIPAYMNSRQMAYAGGDINLATTPVSWCDSSSVADVTILRRCAKNVLYSVVNSNAMNGEVIGYGMPIWQICLIVFDCLLVVGIAVWGFFVVRKALKDDGSDMSSNAE